MEAERASRLSRANEILAEIDRELTRAESPKTLVEQIYKSALADLQIELRELALILGTERHRLVFIGQVAVGKTTAICHLVGLTAERDKRKASRVGPEKVVHVTEDLMATGSGFTTLCEVVVVPSTSNTFSIEPYPPEEVERTISDFCLTIWKRVYPDKLDDGQRTSSGTEPVNFPPELVRAIRNMLKLPGGDRPDEDTALRLAREFPADAFDQFEERVLARANLRARSQTEFEPSANEPDARAWIKKTFDDLNLARLDSVSIPRRITLKVDAKLLSPHMSRVAAVVDTKGVDAAQFNREDLDRHIREDRTALCILAEGFDTAPTNVAPLLQRHITPEAPLSLSKFVLMILPRGGEPEKVVGQQGPVGDRDRGISLRRTQIDETLSSRGIRGLSTLFYDPLRYFEVAGADFKRRSDSEPEEIEADRDETWDAISQAIENRAEKTWDRVTQIGDSLKRIKEGKGLSAAEEELVRQTKPRIAEYRRITLANADRFLEHFRGNWEGQSARHMMTFRATNNRFGVYPHRNVDIYYDAVPITEHLVRGATSRPKDALLEIVRSVRTTSPQDSDLRELFAVLETRIDASFEEMVRQVGAAMQSYLQDTALAPQDESNQFWIDVQSRYGKGRGYREDVLSMYADKLEGHEEFLATTAENYWQRLVIDPVLAYLG